MKGWKRTPSLPKSGHFSGKKNIANYISIVKCGWFKYYNTRPEFWTPIFIYRIDSLSWKLGRRRDLPCGVPMVWLPACMAKRIALASGCRDHEITHCGGDQTMQMYGRFGGFPKFLWCIVWVASIMAPEK